MLARGINAMNAYYEHFAPEDIGFGEDAQHDRNALRAALSSLPRMTEKELIELFAYRAFDAASLRGDFGMNAWTWPEHADDDGYRGDGGWVRIVPSDWQARFRTDAKAGVKALTAKMPHIVTPTHQTEKVKP